MLRRSLTTDNWQRHLMRCMLAIYIIAGNVPTFAAATADTITIKSYAFEPAVLTVTAGTTITWINRDDDPHTVKSEPTNDHSDTGDALKSAALDTNDKYSFTFTKPGVYKYFCTLHPHMQGQITVQ